MAKVTVESVILWMGLAGLTALITFILYRRGKISATTAIVVPILVFYLSFVLTITVFERVPRKRMRYELELFWSYRRGGQLLWENFWNVVLFVPIGMFSSVLAKKKVWLAGVFGFLLSVGIEVTQLITHRGLFEFDDIFHNTVGAVLGMILFVLVRRAAMQIENRRAGDGGESE